MVRSPQKKPTDMKKVEEATPGRWFAAISHLVPDGPTKSVTLSKEANLAAAISPGKKKRAKRPERQFGEIRSRLYELLSPLAPGKVGYNDKVSKYIGPGALQIVAFIDVVDKYPPFRADGLALTPPDIPDDPIVGWFLAAIVSDYERRGWRVLL